MKEDARNNPVGLCIVRSITKLLPPNVIVGRFRMNLRLILGFIFQNLKVRIKRNPKVFFFKGGKGHCFVSPNFYDEEQSSVANYRCLIFNQQ